MVSEVKQAGDFYPWPFLFYNVPISLTLCNKPFFMKSILLFFLVFICFSVKAQKVYSVDYASQADVKVYVVKYESQADLLVFKEKYQSQARGNEGKWFFTDYASQADKKIYFVDYESQADLKIFFVNYESRAGWNKSSKKAMMY